VRFISHLDMQRLLQRTFRRANLPLAYSQGFNPHPLLSFASALAVGYTSDAEWIDIKLAHEADPDELLRSINEALPIGLSVSQVVQATDALPTLTVLTHSARYCVKIESEQPIDPAQVQTAIDTLLNGEIVVVKRTKSGYKPVDIRPQLIDLTLTESTDKALTLEIVGHVNAEGSLNVELLVNELLRICQLSGSVRVHRTDLYFQGTDLLPCPR